MNIVEAFTDENLLRSHFRDLSTWENWMMVLKSIFALELTDEEKIIFKQLTGREAPPKKQVEEAWIIAGRRAGKSFTIALVGVYLACFRSYAAYVSPGERVIVIIVSCDRRQSRVIFNYVLAALESVPMLKAMIDRQDSESIDLSNGVTIEIVTNSFRSLRGFTIGAAILDEVAYWRSEFSANPDGEVLNAIRPAMATVPGGLILAIGSPYRRAGVMYETWKSHYGKDDSPVLVVQATSQQLNPTIPQSIIDRAVEADSIAAQAEWFATFRSDLAALFDLDLIERAVEPGRRERAPAQHVTYRAFCDLSGARSDAFTLAIGHCENERLVLDVIRGVRPPFSHAAVIEEYAAVLKTYRCFSVTGDRWGGDWPRAEFAKHDITYYVSERTASELYLESVHLFTTGIVDLLDCQALTLELMQLERRTGRSGRDSVTHPPNGHDDHANSCCGVLSLLAAQQAQGEAVMWNFLTGEILHSDSEEERALRRESVMTGQSMEAIRARWETVL